jgi:hypothetical protein
VLAVAHICERHPEREGQLAISLPSIGIMRYWCAECRAEYDAKFPSKGFGRAYATGLGPDAHAEAQEAGQLQDEFSRGAKHAEERRYL